MGNMHRPILAQWNFTTRQGAEITDSRFKEGMLSQVQKSGTLNCRGMDLSVKGYLRADSDYDLDEQHPRQVMALKNSDVGIIALTETYSEIILA